MHTERRLPNQDRLSVVIASILLGYALTQFIQAPTQAVNINLLGVLLPLNVNFNNLAALAVAGVTASGAHWLLSDHPHAAQHSTAAHWIVPALSAWILNVLLSNLALSPGWWVLFTTGGVLLVLIILAEYITIDPDDVRQPIAAAGLNALTYALFLTLAISLKSTGPRLIFVLPAMTVTAGLVYLRALHLRIHGTWRVLEALGCGLAIAQFTAALHYFPASPVAFGLFLMGPLYAIINFSISLNQGETIRQAMVEPLTAIGILWGLGLFLG